MYLKEIRNLLKLFVLLVMLQGCKNQDKTIDQVFEKMRQDPSELRLFMKEMPKGGDLHHHYSGSVFPDYLIKWAVEKDLYYNTKNYGLSFTAINKDYRKFSSIKDSRDFDKLKHVILRWWSITDYTPDFYPSHSLFFESFDKFWPALDQKYKEGFMSLRNRAIDEHVSYIETQLNSVKSSMNIDDLNKNYNDRLFTLGQQKNDEKTVLKLLGEIYDIFISRNAQKAVSEHNTKIEDYFNTLPLNDDSFTMRVQNVVYRFLPAVESFQNMVLGFMSADQSKYIVGVNILAPEHHESAMQNYWLHMIMFKFCHQKFPKVKYSLHAGELTQNLVLPEDLSHHIQWAIYLAGAYRIGHGVDIANEENATEILQYMSKEKIAIEINLTSNAFILNVKPKHHPVNLYFLKNVPITINTDDAGILRTDLSEQFVILANNFPNIKYAKIKEIVFNGIEYSFIKEPEIKMRLKNNLEKKFSVFEKQMIDNFK